MAVGAAVGGINGLLIGYLKARPFLTTLVTLIILRASVNILNEKFATVFATNSVDSDTWDFLGEGYVLGVPINAATLIVVLIIGHVFLSRSRYGWHLTAIGASRKAARHAGIPVERMLLCTYALSGMLCAIGGVFYAARQNSTDSTTGVGWEFQALTAVILGGVSLAGGKGTVWRAMLGGIITFVLTNGLVRMGIPGYITSGIIGIILLAAVGIDVKWAKNRGKAIQKIYVNPAAVPLVDSPSLERGSNTPFAQNDRLINAEAIGLNQVEGPEDVILDRHDRLYGSTRDGNIIRFSGPNFEQREVFAHIGGRPLGMQFDQDENLIVAVAGMGVYGIKPNGTALQGDRRDQPHLVQAERRQPAAHGRRSRHRARRQDLFQRLHHALRDDDQFARHHGRAAERPPRRLRSRHQEDLDGDQSFLLPERHLRVA